MLWRVETKKIKLPEIKISDVKAELGRRHFIDFAEQVNQDLTLQPFHKIYYRVLEKFSNKEIKNLIITIGPQHGKSEGSTRLLPSNILGKYPNTKIAIGSYSDPFARQFNRDVQRIIDSTAYHNIFPNTTLNESNVVATSGAWLRNSHIFEVVDHKGGLMAVGRGGALTGFKVDVMIMDDLYKDSSEGNSPVIREKVIDWYTSVVQKRLHNDSQQLIVFTRWHEDDLIGFIEKTDNVVVCNSWDEIDYSLENDPQTWIKINFESLKESDPTEFDPRMFGEALWPSRHSSEKLIKEREKNEHEFNCMNQGNPESQEGLLYQPFKTYTEIPSRVIVKGNYTDVADTGDDYLCSITYDCAYVDKEKYCYVTDIVYTQEAMEETEKTVPLMLNRVGTRKCKVESNSGGRGFARTIEKLTPMCEFITFHQSANKESRILTNSAQVNKYILFPVDWAERWPVFYSHITKYKRMFAANKYDDGPDVLTGIYEEEILNDYEAFL